MPKTYEEQLAEVEAAITKALDKQSWTQGQRAEQNAALEHLFAERKRLQRIVGRRAMGGIRMRRGVPLD
jgi:hypothetical protein